MGKRLTPHQRIVHAARRGTGVRLTADEAEALSRDHAIYTRASLDDQAECEAGWHSTPWYDRRSATCPDCGEGDTPAKGEETDRG